MPRSNKVAGLYDDNDRRLNPTSGLLSVPGGRGTSHCVCRPLAGLGLSGSLPAAFEGAQALPGASLP